MPSLYTDFLERTGPVLCLDIGSGTQDALLASPGLEPENWARFVLPAPARRIAERIAALTEARRDIWLYGGNMGGGMGQAVARHLAAGLEVYATPEAALALHDDPARVAAMGVRPSPVAPAGACAVHLCDHDPGFWRQLLLACGLPLPHVVVACAQDHGLHPEGNRVGRMRHWRTLLQTHPRPEAWLYAQPPAGLTRLAALHRATGGPVADTGTAAICGALCLEEVQARSWREGVTVINVGNSHTLAALVYRGEVCGLYEHHTGQLPLDALLRDLGEFRLGWLPEERVQASGGHGTAFARIPEEAGGFAPTYILGPRRELLRGHGQFIAPYGDMMLAGCHGLLRALSSTDATTRAHHAQ